MSESGTGSCGKCASEISSEATKCPECGYEPSTESKTAQNILFIIGLLLSLTLIGALVGVPLMYFSYKGLKYHKDLKPIDTDPDDTVSLKELINA